MEKTLIKNELLASLNEAKESTKDYTGFIDLFGKDEAKKTIAKLNQTISRIEFNLRLSEIKEVSHPKNNALKSAGKRNGCMVAVRTCDPADGGKTFLGFLVGELALSSNLKIQDDGIVCEWGFYNPLIFIPQLKKTVMGMSSWWSEIDSLEQFKRITDDDINNTWYVRLFDELNSKQDENDKG